MQIDGRHGRLFATPSKIGGFLAIFIKTFPRVREIGKTRPGRPGIFLFSPIRLSGLFQPVRDVRAYSISPCYGDFTPFLGFCFHSFR
jgi:hypothetical protein